MSHVNAMLAEAHKHVQYAKKKLAEDREFAAFLDSVSHLLPDLPYTRIHQHACYAKFQVELEVEKYEDVRPLLDKLPPVDAVKHSDSCTSFRPADVPGEPVFPVWVRCRNVTGPDVAVNWYSNLPDGTRVEVEVKVKQTWGLVRWSGTRRMRDGTVYLADARLRHRFTSPHRVKWWKPADTHIEVTVYWPADASKDMVFTTSAGSEREVS